jgi:hypothetical protein
MRTAQVGMTVALVVSDRTGELGHHHERHDGGANEHQPRPYCPEALRCGMGDGGVGVTGGGFANRAKSCQARYILPSMGRAADYRANGGYEAWERSADYVLVPLALIFLAVLLIPLAVHLTPREQAAFLVANILIWVAFAVDYFVRFYLAPARGRFVRTHVLDSSWCVSHFFDRFVCCE